MGSAMLTSQTKKKHTERSTTKTRRNSTERSSASCGKSKTPNSSPNSTSSSRTCQRTCLPKTWPSFSARLETSSPPKSLQIPSRTQKASASSAFSTKNLSINVLTCNMTKRSGAKYLPSKSRIKKAVKTKKCPSIICK